jgi:ASC-1-like (ASCH) protein
MSSKKEAILKEYWYWDDIGRRLDNGEIIQTPKVRPLCASVNHTCQVCPFKKCSKVVPTRKIIPNSEQISRIMRELSVLYHEYDEKRRFSA